MATSRTGVVTRAVERDLAALVDRSLADTALAALALALAREIDDPENSATSKSMCARSMVDALERLRALEPPAETKDGLDDLTARRSKRLGLTGT